MINYTKNQITRAVLHFAEQYKKLDNYNAIVDSGIDMPKLVRMITYEMFLHQFDISSCDLDSFIKYRIILKYAKELDEHGTVIFAKSS